MEFLHHLASLIAEPWEYVFIQKGICAVILVGLCCALIGTHVILRRLSFIGDGLAHALIQLSERLSYMDRREDALEAIQEHLAPGQWAVVRQPARKELAATAEQLKVLVAQFEVDDDHAVAIRMVPRREVVPLRRIG